MVQSTIDFWIDQTNGNSDIIPYYFYLDWQERFYPKSQATFLTNKEYKNLSTQLLESANFIKVSINNKFTHRPIVIIGNITSYPIPEREEFVYPSDPNYSNIHFLKSHLQKCVRRKKTEKAIQTAKHLLTIDPVAFLRRLAIIFVEDVSPTNFYPTIIWLLVATSSKILTLSTNHKEWLLGAVYVACEAPYREYFPNKYQQRKNIFEETIENKKELEPSIFDLIMSLFLRISYGGMHGDMGMLKCHAETWLTRGKKDNENTEWKSYYEQKVKTISWVVYPLEKNEWEYSAIDFHCFPKMLDWLVEQFPDFQKEEIKEIIWKNRSSLNVRPFFHKNSNQENIVEKNRCQNLIDDNEWLNLMKSLNKISFYAIKTSS